jgi:hypothetical protein
VFQSKLRAEKAKIVQKLNGFRVSHIDATAAHASSLNG